MTILKAVLCKQSKPWIFWVSINVPIKFRWLWSSCSDISKKIPHHKILLLLNDLRRNGSYGVVSLDVLPCNLWGFTRWNSCETFSQESLFRFPIISFSAIRNSQTRTQHLRKRHTSHTCSGTQKIEPQSWPKFSATDRAMFIHDISGVVGSFQGRQL